MPDLPERVLLRTWQHRNEPRRIHYVAVYADGNQRHLYVDADNPLYAVLESHLLLQGTGPASVAEDEQ